MVVHFCETLESNYGSHMLSLLGGYFWLAKHLGAPWRLAQHPIPRGTLGTDETPLEFFSFTIVTIRFLAIRGSRLDVQFE